MTDYLQALLALLPQLEEEEEGDTPPSLGQPAPLPVWAQALQPSGDVMAGEEALLPPAQAARPEAAEAASALSPSALPSLAQASPLGAAEEGSALPGSALAVEANGLLPEGRSGGALSSPLAQQSLERRRPALLEQSQALERAAMQAQALEGAARSRGDGDSLDTLPGRPSAAPSLPSGLNPPAGRGTAERGAAGPAGWEDPARLLDQIFQRDSRRYDRGFSLY